MLPFQKSQSNRNISYGVPWFFEVISRLRTAMRSKAKIDGPINDCRAPSGRLCHRARLPGRRYALGLVVMALTARGSLKGIRGS